MAYKFQLGEAQLSGALVQEGAIKVHNESGTEVANFSQAGIVSGSGQLQGASVAVDGAIDAAGLASLDGGIDVNGAMTVSTAGAVAGVTTLDASGLASLDGGVDVNGNLTISTAGALAGATTITGSGQISGGSLLVDTNAKVASGGTMTIGGTSIDENAFTQIAGITAGTAAASKAVVLDASSNVTGINELTASYFKGDGSGITNINVSNLDATGADKQVQFNQNGEFGANAGLIYNGTGSLGISGSNSGYQVSSLFFGTPGNKQAQIYTQYDLGYALSLVADGVDLSGSDGVTAIIGDTNFSVMSEHASAGITLIDPDENEYFIAERTAVSGAGGFEGASVTVEGNVAAGSLNVAGTNVISSARAIQNVTSITAAGIISGSSNLTLNGGITTDGAIYGIAGLKATDGYGLWANQLTRSAGDLNIQLHDASANSVNFRLADGNMPLKVLSTGIVQMDATRVAIGTTAGEISGSGALKMGGAVQLDGADNSVDFVVADDMYFRDAGTGQMRRDSWADVMSAAAGAGLTATAGVLSTQAQSVHTDFNAGVALEEGYNIYTGSADISVALPTGSGLTAGDVFVVKQNASGDVTIACAGSDLIDGNASVMLESPYAAVSLVYSGVDGAFRIV